VDYLPHLHLFFGGFVMRPLWIFGILLCLLAMQAPAAAQSSLKWSFQRTGFRTPAESFPQTALSMRSGEAWPVVYGFFETSLNAYSLFPVVNPKGKHHVSPATNWHQIGSNLAGSQFSSYKMYLQADSGSPDGFAVSAQTAASVMSQPQDAVAIGNSLSGFQSPMLGVQAVKFDNDGNPFTATNSTIPNLSPSQKLFDIATSSTGDVGAVTQVSSGNGPLSFWQRSPLLGNNWYSTIVPMDSRIDETLFGPTIDLSFDAASRPHIIGINRLTSLNRVSAYRFDITTGAWTSSILDTAANGAPPIADVASAVTEDGIVGAAWVNNGALKYAYLNTNEVSPHWVVTSVANTTPTGIPLELSQGVGLAFDNAGLPVISFVDRTTRQIWVAYDPPTAFGGAITDQPGAEGDFNGDGFVDGYDVDAWGIGFGEGTLGGNDFLAWQRNANIAEPSAATAAVPEPLALSSACVAATLLFGSMRKPRRTAN
jgi:hypothetical protein